MKKVVSPQEQRIQYEIEEKNQHSSMKIVRQKF